MIPEDYHLLAKIRTFKEHYKYPFLLTLLCHLRTHLNHFLSVSQRESRRTPPIHLPRKSWRTPLTAPRLVWALGQLLLQTLLLQMQTFLLPTQTPLLQTLTCLLQTQTL